MGGFGRRQGAGGVQALPLLGMPNLGTLSRQLSPLVGPLVMPRSARWPSDCRCEASSLMPGVRVRLSQPARTDAFPIASELRRERPTVIHEPSTTLTPHPHLPRGSLHTGLRSWGCGGFSSHPPPGGLRLRGQAAWRVS